MSSGKRFSAVYVRPQKDFGSFSEVTSCCGLDGVHTLKPKHFDVPLISIVVDGNGLPVWEPTRYLAYRSLRGRSSTGDTVRSYSEALLTWFAFAMESGIDFRSATEDDFAHFRVRAVHRRSFANGRVWASATANHRISAVADFYLWAQRRGVLHTPLGTFLNDRQNMQRGHGDAQTPHRLFRAQPLAPAVMSRMPRILSRDEIHRLFQIAPSPYNLMFKWALVTGLRRFEICNLSITQLSSAKQLALSDERFVPIDVLRKGRRDATVYAPRFLVEETQWYALTDRPEPAAEAIDQVFLGARGKAIDRASLSRIFRKVADSIGSDATFHHLRHTFAVNVLRILENRRTDSDLLNPVKTLQVLLGHASIETTGVYLRAMEVTGDAVMEALDYLYGATL